MPGPISVCPASSSTSYYLHENPHIFAAPVRHITGSLCFATEEIQEKKDRADAAQIMTVKHRIYFLVAVGFLLVESKDSSGAGPGEKSDPGQPLFLTPLIKSGRLQEARQQSRVTGLPWAPPDGGSPLSYSGYLTVNSTCNKNLFFWYFPVQVEQPSEVPVLLWLQGGPGKTSLSGLFVEHGPLKVSKDHKLSRREETWSSDYHTVYVDQPVGTGYSFADCKDAYVKDPGQAADDVYQALLQFFTLFPDLQKSDFYVTGESYAGKWVPAISAKLSLEKPEIIRFKGMAVGNGLIDMESSMVFGQHLYQLGLLDEEQRDFFLNQQEKARILIHMKEYRKAFDIMDSLILGFSPDLKTSFNNFTGMSYKYNILQTKKPEDQAYYKNYVEKSSVRKSIHVGNRTFVDYSHEVIEHLKDTYMQSTTDLVEELLDGNYKVLIYNGQLDVRISPAAEDNLVRNLNWTGSDLFRNAERKIWKVNRGDPEVAGYVRQAEHLYHVLVRNAGHSAPYEQPRAVKDMIKRFISGNPFA